MHMCIIILFCENVHVHLWYVIRVYSSLCNVQYSQSSVIRTPLVMVFAH